MASIVKKDQFEKELTAAYTFDGASVVLGGAMFNKAPVQGLQVKIPLRTINRHGLIAGATGTGKTKSLQLFVEQLSLAGVPSVVMDIKGDLSGLARPGSTNKHVVFRTEAAALDYKPQGFPVELLGLAGGEEVPMRATISEFGPVLLSKMLGLNATQSSILAVLFKYSDDHKMPLFNIEDLKAFLRYVLNAGKDEVQKEYGRLSSASLNTILRKLVALEQQGAGDFFGEPSFDVQDFLSVERDGRGLISIVRLMDMQDRPALFSTFMLSLLAEIYGTLPEVGDLDKPKLAFFIDEAHLLFKNASDALLDQIEVIIKLIRSKGVGIYFVTQDPTDIPEDVLGQLGTKIQHALRAFTAKDRKQIRQLSQNFPVSPYYDIAESLTQVGLGEALITCLDEKGIPTPLVHTLMRPPLSRMDILSDTEVRDCIRQSVLMAKYHQEINSESAEEILRAKMKQAEVDAVQEERLKEEMDKAGSARKKKAGKESSWLGEMSKNTMVRQIGRTVFRELSRGLLGVLGVKK